MQLVMQTIAQTRVTPTNEGTHYYGYDGHGNVRFLTDADGVITDGWDYDLPSPQGSGQTGAFGNIITRSGTTVNHLVYCGEYLDPDLGLYFLRARYMDTDRGRFWTMDPFEGVAQDPPTLHKYVYACANPVSYIDPLGREGRLVEVCIVSAIRMILHVGNIINIVAYGITSRYSLGDTADCWNRCMTDKVEVLELQTIAALEFLASIPKWAAGADYGANQSPYTSLVRVMSIKGLGVPMTTWLANWLKRGALIGKPVYAVNAAYFLLSGYVSYNSISCYFQCNRNPSSY